MKVNTDSMRRQMMKYFNQAAYLWGCGVDIREPMNSLGDLIAAFMCMYDPKDEHFSDLSNEAKLYNIPEKE